MCTHHWIIDSKNQGACKKCGQTHDFKPDIDKVFKYTKPNTLYASEGYHLDFLDLSRDYYMQGSIEHKTSRFTLDFCEV